MSLGKVVSLLFVNLQRGSSLLWYAGIFRKNCESVRERDRAVRESVVRAARETISYESELLVRFQGWDLLIRVVFPAVRRLGVESAREEAACS